MKVLSPTALSLIYKVWNKWISIMSAVSNWRISVVAGECVSELMEESRGYTVLSVISDWNMGENLLSGISLPLRRTSNRHQVRQQNINILLYYFLVSSARLGTVIYTHDSLLDCSLVVALHQLRCCAHDIATCAVNVCENNTQLVLSKHVESVALTSVCRPVKDFKSRPLAAIVETNYYST